MRTAAQAIPGEDAYRQADASTAAFASPAMVRAYRRAVERRMLGRDASEEMVYIRERLGRAMVIFGLVGRLAMLRSLRRQGLIPEPEPSPPLRSAPAFARDATFAIAPPELVSEPYLLALNRFRAEIPEAEPSPPLRSAPAFSRDATFAIAPPELVSEPYLLALNRFRAEIPDLGPQVDRLTAAATIRAERSLPLDGSWLDREIRAAITPLNAPSLTFRGIQVAPDAITDAMLRVVGERVERVVRTEVRTVSMAAYNDAQRETATENADVVPLLELNEIHDPRTRGNPQRDPGGIPHWQMNGFIAETSDPIWRIITPPNGWNCRGFIRPISTAEAIRRRLARRDESGRAVILRGVLEDRMTRYRQILATGRYPEPGFR